MESEAVHNEVRTRYGNRRDDEEWFLNLLRDSDTSTTPSFIPKEKEEEDDV